MSQLIELILLNMPVFKSSFYHVPLLRYWHFKFCEMELLIKTSHVEFSLYSYKQLCRWSNYIVLTDDKTLKECGLKDGIKLFLLLKKEDGASGSKSASPAPSGPDFWQELRRFLRKHFTEQDAENVLLEYKKVRIDS